MAPVTKKTGLNILNITGCFNLSKIIYMNKVKILAYHRFGSGKFNVEMFEKQIRYLKNNFNPINLEDYLKCLYFKKKLSINSVLITVDDGYQDFYTYAFPILKKYEVPTTVFLTTDFIDKKIWLWHDLIDFGIQSTERTDFKINNRIFNLRNQSDKQELKLFLDQICTSLNTIEKFEFISKFLKELSVRTPEIPTAAYAPLTWDQIHEMSGSDVTFGAHTCTHLILSRAMHDEALREIGESKRKIEDVLQKEVTTFCYPNGKETDFNKDIEKMVRDCGFACAMSMIYGINDSRTDPFELHRMAAQDSFIHFMHDITGFGELRRFLSEI